MILALGFSMMPISNAFTESDNMEYRMVSIFNEDNIESNQFGVKNIILIILVHYGLIK